MKRSLTFLILLFFLVPLSRAFGEELRLKDWLDIPIQRNRPLWDRYECNWLAGLVGEKTVYGPLTPTYVRARKPLLEHPRYRKWLVKNWELGCRDWLVAYYYYLPDSLRFEVISYRVDMLVEELKKKQLEFFEPDKEFERTFDLRKANWKEHPLRMWLEEQLKIEVVFDQEKLGNGDEAEAEKRLIALELTLAGLERIVKFDELLPATRFVVGQYLMEKLLTTKVRADSLDDRLGMHSTLCRYLWEHKALWMKTLALVETLRILGFYKNFLQSKGATYIGIRYEAPIVNDVFREYFRPHVCGRPDCDSIKGWLPMLREYLITVPAKRRIALVKDYGRWGFLSEKGHRFLADVFTYFANERPRTPHVFVEKKRYLVDNPPIVKIVNGKTFRQVPPRTVGEAFVVTLDDDFLPTPLVLMRYFITEDEPQKTPEFVISTRQTDLNNSEIAVAWVSNGMIRFFSTRFCRKDVFVTIDKDRFEFFKNAPLFKSVKPETAEKEDPSSVVNTFVLLEPGIVEKLRKGEEPHLTGVAATGKYYRVFARIGDAYYSFKREKNGTTWTVEKEE